MKSITRHQKQWLWLGLVLMGLIFGRGHSALAQEDESDATTHIVRYGETLSEIAQAYEVSMPTVMQENAIQNADSIYVGQPLVIPLEVVTTKDVDQSETIARADPPPAPTQISVAARNQIYTVALGDTLPWIALRYGVNLQALKALNQINEASSIYVGKELILPATEEELQVRPMLESYTVQAGDSVGHIATAFDVSVADLLAVNRIRNADLIQPGQVLQIPQTIEKQAAPQVGPSYSGFYYHTVQPGETLSQLAAVYDSTPQAIVRYNNLPDEATVFAGLEVRIPFGPPILERRQPLVPHSGTAFVVSISRQRCWVMQGNHVLHAWKCSTGQGKWVTRTGTFHVKTKMEMAKSNAYRLDMPYWLGIYDVGTYENGIHGIPVEWESGEKLWDNLVGQPATFGCAMLLDKDAAILYDLAYIGMPVHVVE